MDNNLGWLVAAYGVIWAALFIFVWQLFSRQARLRSELEKLRREG